MSAGPAWAIEHHHGAASAFHAFEPAGAGRLAMWLHVDRPALVLGSAQRESVVDAEACAAAGVDVVRRRSGGGVVLLQPDRCAWLDVVVPAGDPLWVADVGRAMWWLGEVWAEALESLGCVDVQVHRGPVQHTRWSSLVCFDGLGAGEVTVAGGKAVGISQRRTRRWARLQSSVYLAPPGDVTPLLAPPRPTAAQLRPPAVIDANLIALQSAVEAALDRR